MRIRTISERASPRKVYPDFRRSKVAAVVALITLAPVARDVRAYYLLLYLPSRLFVSLARHAVPEHLSDPLDFLL